MLPRDQNIFISLPLEDFRYLRAVFLKHGHAYESPEILHF